MNFLKSLRRASAFCRAPALVLAMFSLSSCGGGGLFGAPESPPLGFSVIWRVSLGESAPHLAPQRFGNRVCAADEDGVHILNFDDGRIVATMPAANISAGAGCGDGIAAVNSGGELIVGDENGGELWRAQLTGTILARPIFSGGRIFTLGMDGALSAYPARRQEHLWRRLAAQESPAYRVRIDSTPALDDGVLYVGQGGGRLGAVRATDGDVLWDVLFAEPQGGGAVADIVDLTTPVVAGDAVCAAAFQSVAGCVARRNGALLWSAPLSAQYRAAAAQQDGEWLLFAASQEGHLSAFSVADGALLWRREEGDVRSALLAAGGAVLGADAEGVLRAFAAENGVELDALSLDGSPITGLAPAGEEGQFLAQTAFGTIMRMQVSRTIAQ